MHAFGVIENIVRTKEDKIKLCLSLDINDVEEECFFLFDNMEEFKKSNLQKKQEIRVSGLGYDALGFYCTEVSPA